MVPFRLIGRIEGHRRRLAGAQRSGQRSTAQVKEGTREDNLQPKRTRRWHWADRSAEPQKRQHSAIGDVIGMVRHQDHGREGGPARVLQKRRIPFVTQGSLVNRRWRSEGKRGGGIEPKHLRPSTDAFRNA